MKDVLIQFSGLAKLPKPSKGSLAPKQITELQQWASINGKSVRQNTTRNFSTKDKPGTLSLNIYEASPPNENTVDFAALLGESGTDGNKEREDSGQDRADIEILHPNVTFVLFPHICRPGSLPTSTFYILKLLEHLPDDDYVAHVRTDWYAQDLVDPILFTTTGEEYTVSKDGIKLLFAAVQKNSSKLTFSRSTVVLTVALATSELKACAGGILLRGIILHWQRCSLRVLV